ELEKLDSNFGSILFSVQIHKVNGINIDRKYKKSDNFDECIYITKATEEAQDRVSETLTAYNDEQREQFQKQVYKVFNQRKLEFSDKSKIDTNQLLNDTIKQ